MSKHILMSWKNKSTDLNELQGEATYKVPSPIPWNRSIEAKVSLDSFKTAHELWGVLEAAYNLGKANAEFDVAEQLKVLMKTLYAASGQEYN